jgi:hypothetical protein
LKLITDPQFPEGPSNARRKLNLNRFHHTFLGRTAIRLPWTQVRAAPDLRPQGNSCPFCSFPNTGFPSSDTPCPRGRVRTFNGVPLNQ